MKSLIKSFIKEGLISVLVLVFMLTLSGTTTFAAQGGEGDNTNCNGVGNPNSPCEGSGHGNNGHHTPIIYNNNTDTSNRNYNKSVNELGQGQVQIQDQGQAQGNTNTIQGDNVKVYAPAPSAFAPNLTAAPETCFGSTSAGASGGNGIFGFGVSFGTTWKSDDCELRMFARSLLQLGQTQAALSLLSQNEKVAAALKAVGAEVPASK